MLVPNCVTYNNYCMSENDMMYLKAKRGKQDLLGNIG